MSIFSQASGNWSVEVSSAPGRNVHSKNDNRELLDRFLPAVINDTNSDNSLSNASVETRNIESRVNNLQLPRDNVIVTRKSSGYRKTADIARIIPDFDGINLSVNQFIHECKDAEIFVDPEDRLFFIRLVKSKVIGNARSYLQYKNFDTLDDLLNELKRSSAPSQNLPQIQTELARALQNSDEKVSEYGLRITQILHRAIELINEKYDSIFASGIAKGTESTAIECFNLGLRDLIAQQLIGKNPVTLEEAISFAIEAEKRVNQRNELHGGRILENQNPLKRTRCQVVNAQNPRQPKGCCFRCGKSDHYIKDCKEENNFSVANSDEEKRSHCSRCGMSGHVTASCKIKKEKIDSGRSSQDNSSQGGQQIKTNCFLCGLSDHHMKDCRVKQEKINPDSSYCFYCKCFGHHIGNCERKKPNKNPRVPEKPLNLNPTRQVQTRSIQITEHKFI